VKNERDCLQKYSGKKAVKVFVGISCEIMAGLPQKVWWD